MGWKAFAVGLVAGLALVVAVAAAPRAGAAGKGRPGAAAHGRRGARGRGRPGALDPSFGRGGRAIARSTAEVAPSEFAASSSLPDGDLALELRRQIVGEEVVREIELRTPSGALKPAFGKGGKLAVGRGRGLVALPDGDLLVGVTECGGSPSSVMMVDGRGNRVPSFGKDGCGAAAGFATKFMALDPQGRILLLGASSYCPPCGHDEIPSVEAVVARILPDGALDPGFGKNGVVGTHADDHLELEGFDAGTYQPSGLAAAPDGGVLIGKGGGVIRLAPDGSLDQGYGKGGVAAVPGHTGRLAVGADGSVFVVSAEYSDETASVTKFSPTGAPDPGFGEAGTAALPSPSEGDVESDQVAAAPDGGVLVGAGTFPGAGCVRPCEETPAVTRFTAAGRPDPSFGDDGVARLALASAQLPSPPALRSLSVGADGSILAAGSDEGEDAFVVALTSGGTPRPSFGEAGTVIERNERQALLEATGFYRRPDGGFTVAAQRYGLPGARVAYLVQFGAGGRQRRFPGGAYAAETFAHGIVVPDGAGRPVAWGGDGESDRALTAAGRAGKLLDKRYGKAGVAAFPKGLYPEEVAPAPGGGAAVIGVIGRAMAVYRIGPKGRPVPGFGRNGLATVSFADGAAIGFAGLVEADGDVVLTGSVGAYTGAARLLPSGRLDRSFGRGGRVSQLLGRDSFGTRMAPWRGGVVIAAAEEATPQRNGGLVGLRPDGRLDRAFGHDGVVRGGAEKPPLALLTEADHLVTVTNPTFERGHRGEGVELRAWNADGSVDRAFGHDGVRFFGSGLGKEQQFDPAAALQQSDGKVVIAGTTAYRLPGRGPSTLRAKAELVRFLLR